MFKILILCSLVCTISARVPAVQSFCTREYAPVCGVDGKTYSNECFAKYKKIKIVHNGKCRGTERRVCTSERNPVCGGDRKTYRNKCTATVAKVKILHKGECRQFLSLASPHTAATGVCPTEKSPVCAANGKTYLNRCFASKAGLQVAYDGPCLHHDTDKDLHRTSKVGCPRDLRPVCGSNGRTYPNECVARFAKVKVIYEGKCQPPTAACTFEYAPVCGVDLKTYDNPCIATKIAKVAILYDGECEQQVACSFEYHEVCGIDGKTYGNPCMATKIYKVKILHDGPCLVQQ